MPSFARSSRFLAGSCLSALALACGGSDSGDMTCPDLDGTYLLHYSERSGDCGPLDDQIEQYDPNEPATIEPPDGGACDTTSDISPDGCDVEYETHCMDESGAARASGSERWTGIEKAEGIFELELRDAQGDLVCRSVYDVTTERQ